LGEGIERDSKVLGVKNAPRRVRFSTAKNKVLAFFTRWICLLGIGNIGVHEFPMYDVRIEKTKQFFDDC